jgi:hypothetical protein
MHNLRNLALLFIRKMGKKIFEGDAVTPEEIKYKNRLLELHHAWLLNFKAFERDKPLSKEDKIGVSSIMVSYYSTYTYINSVTDPSQTVYDQLLDEFKDLNHHARIILNAMNLAPPATDYSSLSDTSRGTMTVSSPKPNPAANFTFEISVVPPLFYCANHCRCPITRREAISLLELNPPREGLWDPEQCALVARRALELEESQVDPETGWPLEKTRLYGVIINGNMDGNGRFSARFSNGFRRHIPSGKWEEMVWEEWFVL